MAGPEVAATKTSPPAGAAPAQQAAESAAMPLYVDLDGTLTPTDIAQEQLIAALGSWPGLRAVLKPGLRRDIAGVKQAAQSASAAQAELLPYNAAVIDYLRAARQQGRRVVLATAADRAVADSVAAHLGLFDAVLASGPGRNLKGAAKLEAIRADAGGAPFEYIGDSGADLPIWAAAAVRSTVNPRGRARRIAAAQEGPPGLRVADRAPAWKGLWRAARPHQWAKNVLVFVPILFAHAYGAGAVLGLGLLAFAAMSLVASGTYMLNDLLDLASDRRHPSKRHRPFAAGAVAPLTGVLCGLGLIAGGFALAFAALGAAFGLTLAVYLALSLVYSLHLKGYSTIDVIALGLMFTLRIVAGGVATGIAISPWLLTFSLFFFTSLAYMKRFIELARVAEDAKLPSRNYWGTEATMVMIFGISTAAMSLLTLAQYLMLPKVQLMYPGAPLLWLVLPLMMFWTYRNWTWASRGKVDDDPVIFALRDRISRRTMALVVAVVLAARYLPLEVPVS